MHFLNWRFSASAKARTRVIAAIGKSVGAPVRVGRAAPASSAIVRLFLNSTKLRLRLWDRPVPPRTAPTGRLKLVALGPLCNADLGVPPLGMHAARPYSWPAAT
jgi:hypothetical protein